MDTGKLEIMPLAPWGREEATLGGEPGPVWICGLKTPGLEGISFNPWACQSWPVASRVLPPAQAHHTSVHSRHSPRKDGGIFLHCWTPTQIPTYIHTPLLLSLCGGSQAAVPHRETGVIGRQTVCSTAPQERRVTWSLLL